MNSELSKILGREFLIAFLLPALLFFAGLSYSLKLVGHENLWKLLEFVDPLKDTALVVLFAFVLGVFLQSVNRELFRILEGYWPRRLRSHFEDNQLVRFRTLRNELQTLEHAREVHQQAAPNTPFPDQKRLNELAGQAANQFPSREDLVLPTSFGNAVRAYEDYPRIMYGLESIQAWSRLQPFISSGLREVIRQNRTRLDMWLNLFYLAMALVLTNGVLAFQVEQVRLLMMAAACLLGCFLFYNRTESSAKQYGEQVKAVYDLYIGDLAAKLGFELSSDLEKNQKFWRAFSRAMLYRKADSLQAMIASGLERASAKPVEASEDAFDDD